MKKRNIFVVIDGVDGSGKTTCSELLAEKVLAHCYKTPPKPFNKIRGRIDRLKLFNIRFLFYILSVVYSSIVIKHLLKTKTVICDRYIFSTLAYHRALGVKLAKKAIFEKLPIIKPDVSIYLWADRITSNRRLKKLKKDSSDKYIEQNGILQKKIHDEFLKLPIIFIDTSQLTAEQVCIEIMRLLKTK